MSDTLQIVGRMIQEVIGDDWDLDGVLDEDEPEPQTLLEQVHVQQCTIAGGTIEGIELVEAAEFIDWDSMDSDDLPTIDRVHDRGGRRHSHGEEAYLETVLAGGQRYLVVVGAGPETGGYQLQVRQIE